MRSQDKAIFSGVLQKKKKGHHLSAVKFAGTCENTIGVRAHVKIF